MHKKKTNFKEFDHCRTFDIPSSRTQNKQASFIMANSIDLATQIAAFHSNLDQINLFRTFIATKGLKIKI